MTTVFTIHPLMAFCERLRTYSFHNMSSAWLRMILSEALRKSGRILHRN